MRTHLTPTRTIGDEDGLDVRQPVPEGLDSAEPAAVAVWGTPPLGGQARVRCSPGETC